MNDGEAQKYYNATTLAKKLGVHYKTVIFWWNTGRLEGAHKSPFSREILIPISTAEKLFKDYGVRV